MSEFSRISFIEETEKLANTLYLAAITVSWGIPYTTKTAGLSSTLANCAVYVYVRDFM